MRPGGEAGSEVNRSWLGGAPTISPMQVALLGPLSTVHTLSTVHLGPLGQSPRISQVRIW